MRVVYALSVRGSPAFRLEMEYWQCPGILATNHSHWFEIGTSFTRGDRPQQTVPEAPSPPRRAAIVKRES